MASYSEDTTSYYDRIAARVRQEAPEASSVSGPNGSTSTDDIIAGCGGHFLSAQGDNVGTGEAYPPHLDFSEEEDDVANSRSHEDVNQLYAHLPTSRDRSPSLSHSDPHTPTNRREHILQYIQPGHLPFLITNIAPRSRTCSSVGPASNSSYVSAQPYQQSTSTLSTADNNIENDVENGGHTPYFTPSHTPSHHSVGTAEEEIDEGKAPDSPLPYSNYHPYNPHYGKRMIEGFEERYQGA